MHFASPLLVATVGPTPLGIPETGLLQPSRLFVSKQTLSSYPRPGEEECKATRMVLTQHTWISKPTPEGSLTTTRIKTETSAAGKVKHFIRLVTPR